MSGPFAEQALGQSPVWSIMNKPCGHSYALLCGCGSLPVRYEAFNGLCQCRGPLNLHPFHIEPLAPEYVGKHRKEG